MNAPVPYTQGSSLPHVPSTYVRIRTLTWTKEVQGLFDYESRELFRTTLRARADSTLYFTGEYIQLAPNEELKELAEEEKSLKLVKLSKEADKYFIEAMADGMAMTHQLWFIIRSLKIQVPKTEYVLSQDDVLRLGRVMFRVALEPSGKKSWVDNSALSFSVSRSIPSGSFKGMCKFCYGVENDHLNPLVSICKCKGSMGCVHISCLKAWVNTGVIKKSKPHITSYYWKSFACEVCKFPYPLVIASEESRHLLIDTEPLEETSESPSLLLYSLNRDKEYSQVVHLLKPDATKSQFLMGRSHETDVKINDNTVSRFHAEILYTSKGFIIEDNVSKFGTLVLLRGKQELKKGISVQVDRSVITLGIKEDSKRNPTKVESCTFQVAPPSPRERASGDTIVALGENATSTECSQNIKKKSL